MKQMSLALAATLLLASCSREAQQSEITTAAETLSAAKKKATTAQRIDFTQTNLFPEGVVYDPFNNWFYVSSLTRGDIGIVKTDGSYTTFIDDPALVATNGLELDAARKRLLVTNNVGGVGAYDLRTGQRLWYADLAALAPGAPLFINDVALDPQGNAYVTNSASPIIYKITPDGQASIFFQSDAFALTSGFGFNGIEWGTDGGGYLLVAFSARNQVIKFSAKDPAQYSVVQLDALLAGPDGLLLSKDGKQLIVVSNAGGTDAARVQSFTTNNKWASGTQTDTYATGAVFPTTATSDGKNVYVLYAYLNQRATGRDVFNIQQVPLSDTRPF
ncbi:SMP-30/gluconolactonase/LRE family protein [Pseudocnuella soli]|uniref:SMP-30/gluconolactonase/LRE family protein n=1 Tax=Pseudocnuella soli TaxID=2502779 RepID=UPI00104B9F4A|nr:SMP-30/gluconolactonase/LRE family protein [Pseudocnuella soli]